MRRAFAIAIGGVISYDECLFLSNERRLATYTDGGWRQKKTLGPSLVSDWDWAQNRKLISAVRYHINKRLSVEKNASWSVLLVH